MHWIFTLMLYYPVWAFPLALGCIQLGIHYKRRKAVNQYFFWAASLLIFGTSAAWIYYRGDLHGARWLEDTFGIQRTQWD